MTALSDARKSMDSSVGRMYEDASRMKASGLLPAPQFDGSGMSLPGIQTGHKYRYALFHGWVYSAVHAIASEAADRPFSVGRMSGGGGKSRSSVSRQKCPETLKAHLGRFGQLDVLPDHPILDAMDQPNEIQARWQFVYSFVANLAITGWSYVVGGPGDEGSVRFYSLPTTWITPLHKKGPFSEFSIQNPNNVESKPVVLSRENVAFAHLPNPADMMGAMAPTAAQIQAIRIDDHIQTSQERFFENGIFPSVIVEMGKDPHPDGMGNAIRPRLNAEQRRQVIGAIRKAMGGVANMGTPAIIDGLIESIRPFSLTQREMGWDKSEEKIRTRILSAYGVHPYILGEPVNIGGYAQAAKIEERYCKRVNVYLGMLTTLINNFLIPMYQESQRLMGWFEPCEPKDPNLYWQNIREGRRTGDVTGEEFRTLLGLPAQPDDPKERRNALFASTGGAQWAYQVALSVAEGKIKPEDARRLLAAFFERSEAEMDFVGDGPSEDSEEEEMSEQIEELVRAIREPVRIKE